MTFESILIMRSLSVSAKNEKMYDSLIFSLKIFSCNFLIGFKSQYLDILRLSDIYVSFTPL